MKTPYMILILGIIIVGSVIFALSFEYSFEKEHYEIEIKGMKDSYYVGEEYSFYYTLSGFGNTCGSWLMSYPDKNGVIQHRGEVVDCTHISNSYLSYNSTQDGRKFTSLVPEIAGTYNATVSLENGATAVNKFIVLSKKEQPRTPPLEPEMMPESEKIPMIEISPGRILNDKAIEIIGWTNQIQDITLSITAPNGNIVSTGKLFPMNNGTFTDAITTGGPLWKQQDGIYLVTVQQLNDHTVSAYFELTLKDGNIIAVK